MKENLTSWGKSNEELAEEMNLDNIENFKYLKMCFYEALRHESPLPYSTTVCLTED